MCSTPPARARSYMPMPMEPAMVVTDVIAPAHIRSIASPGTVCGRPARIATERPSVSPWSPVCDVAAMATSSMRSAGTAELRSIRPIVAFTARSSARVFQYMPFSPARPKGVRIPSTKKTSEISATPASIGWDTASLGECPWRQESVGSNLRSGFHRIRIDLRAFYKSGCDLLCSMRNLPRARAEVGECFADGIRGECRRVPGDPAQVFRGEEVLGRHVQLFGDGLDDGTRRLQP